MLFRSISILDIIIKWTRTVNISTSLPLPPPESSTTNNSNSVLPSTPSAPPFNLFNEPQSNKDLLPFNLNKNQFLVSKIQHDELLFSHTKQHSLRLKKIA